MDNTIPYDSVETVVIIESRFYPFRIDYTYDLINSYEERQCSLLYIFDHEDILNNLKEDKSTSDLLNNTIGEYNSYVFYKINRPSKPDEFNALELFKGLRPKEKIKFKDLPINIHKSLLDKEMKLDTSKMYSPDNSFSRFADDTIRANFSISAKNIIESITRVSEEMYFFGIDYVLHSESFNPATPVFITKKSVEEFLDYQQKIKKYIKLNKFSK